MARRPKLQTSKLHVPLGDCSFSIHPNNIHLPGLLSYYETLRSYVQHEDDLINSRLTWSLTVHGFLFATWGILLGKTADMLLELHKWAELHQKDLLQVQGSPHRLEQIIFYLVAFQLPIALFGAAVAWQSQQAIYAAHRALVHLESIAHQGLFKLNPAGHPLPADSVLLPKIVSGGAADHGGPRSYYLNLPRGAKYIWLFLFLLSVAFLLMHDSFFSWFLYS